MSFVVGLVVCGVVGWLVGCGGWCLWLVVVWLGWGGGVCSLEGIKKGVKYPLNY